MGFRIVIVDDDEDDFFLIKDAFNELKLPHLLDHKKDGTQLLEYLSEISRAGRGFPNLILLDINMPKLNGIQTLEKIKEEKSYQGIPIIMYTTSSHYDQKSRCIQLGASAFVTKAFDHKKTLSFVKLIDGFLNYVKPIDWDDWGKNRT